MPVYDPHAGPSVLPCKVQVIKTAEKGSGVNLASYMILDACRQDCDLAVVAVHVVAKPVGRSLER
jgi:hypothetical protein